MTSWRNRLLRWSRRNPALAVAIATVALLSVFLAVAGPVVALNQIATVRKEIRRSQAFSTRRAYDAWHQGHVAQVADLLWIHKDDPYAVSQRGFAWKHLWNRVRSLDDIPAIMYEFDGSSWIELSPVTNWGRTKLSVLFRSHQMRTW